MEGVENLPPPNPPAPSIGESSKVRSIMEILNISKILALVIGILGFALAAWYLIWLAIIPGAYWILTGIINLLLYMRHEEFMGLIRGRRYQELKDTMLVWMVLGIIFGFIVGILLLIVYIQVEDLLTSRSYMPPPAPPAPPPP